MAKRIALIQGHPDTDPARFCRAFAAGYAAGAEAAGHRVDVIDPAALSFPWLRSQAEHEDGTPPEAIACAQDVIAKADHLVVIFPLWLGDMPALLKAFLEQTLRPGFAYGSDGPRKGPGMPRRRLKGKSARVVVTMGMPAFFYRWYYRAHGLKNLRRNILAFCGFAPVRATLIGGIASKNAARRAQWLARAHDLGRRAS